MIKYTSNNKNDIIIGTKGSAGIDLFCNEDRWVMPFSSRKIDLGIGIELPKNSYGFLTARSSTRITRGLDVVNGIIDSDYRGNIKAVFVNNTFIPRKIRRGDRLVQLIVSSIYKSPFYTNFVKVDTLNLTDRGANGFGSTGEGSL